MSDARAPLRVLILEDNADDAELTVLELEQAGFDLTWVRVDTKTAFAQQLEPAPDLVIADYNVPDFEAPEALHFLRQVLPDVPFVVVSGAVGEEAIADLLKHGADDYVMKDRPARLVEAVRRALDRRRLEREARIARDVLEESERRFRLLAHHARDVIYRCTLPDFRFEYVSPAVSAITGYEAFEFYADSELMFRIAEPHHRDALRGYLRDPLQHEGPFAYGAVRRNGDLIWLEQLASIEVGADGARSLDGVIRDVTDRERAAEALREAYEREAAAAASLREADSLKDEFLTTISQELRTPLTLLRGWVEVLRDQELDEEHRREYLDHMVDGSKQLEQIVDDLLDLKRLRWGSMAVDPKPTSLRAVVDEVLAGLDDWGRRVTVDVPNEDVVVDEGYVRSILHHLTRNALRYTSDDTAIVISAAVDGGEVVLTVEDDGPGVPDDLKETIFTPFRRGVPREARSGPGVGLTVVKRLAELHDGTAWVEDREGGGSRFFVTLATKEAPRSSSVTRVRRSSA